MEERNSPSILTTYIVLLLLVNNTHHHPTVRLLVLPFTWLAFKNLAFKLMWFTFILDILYFIFSYCLKKIIIGHICYSKWNFVPSTPHTQNFVWIKTCPIIIVFKSIAIWKRLVIYYCTLGAPIFFVLTLMKNDLFLVNKLTLVLQENGFQNLKIWNYQWR